MESLKKTKRSYSEEGKRKLSLARKGKRTGANNSNWKGGVPKCLLCGGLTSLNGYPKQKVTYCQSCYLEKVKIGANVWNWKGGISKTKEYRAYHSKVNRDTRKRNAVGKYSLSEWEALKMKYHYMCLCCKRSEPEIKLTVDHIIPLSKGGPNTIGNLQPLCFSCNSRKRTKTISYLET